MTHVCVAKIFAQAIFCAMSKNLVNDIRVICNRPLILVLVFGFGASVYVCVFAGNRVLNDAKLRLVLRSIIFRTLFAGRYLVATCAGVVAAAAAISVFIFVTKCFPLCSWHLLSHSAYLRLS